METTDIDFEAMKDMARLMYLLNFEAVATVPGNEDAIVAPH
jgi:hypothetical protein